MTNCILPKVVMTKFVKSVVCEIWDVTSRLIGSYFFIPIP